MEKLSMRKGNGKAKKTLVRQRVFAVKRIHESEDARIRADAERAIARVLSDWGERENGRLEKMPSAVEELVRFYCLDYERRQKALEERERVRAKSEQEGKGDTESGKNPPLQESVIDNQTLHTDGTSHRRRKTYREKSGTQNTLRIARKLAGKDSLSAPTAAHYRRLNMLIDLSLALTCDEGIVAAMRHDIAERRGDRRTALYYVDRRAYLRQKRMAKLAIAASLGLL